MMPPGGGPGGNPNNDGGWGGGPQGGPRGQQPNWGGGNNPRWNMDHDASPTMTRRPPGPMDDSGGTSLWGNKAPNQNGPSNSSRWQDMPNMNMGRPGNPGPPGPNRGMMPPGGGMGPGPKEPWGGPPSHVGGGRGGGGGSGWGDDPIPKSTGGGGGGGGGWGGGAPNDDMKREGGNGSGWGPSNPDPNWNKPPQPRMPMAPNMRSSPNSNWGDDVSMPDGPSGWGSKPDGMPKMGGPGGPSKEMIWNSKPFRMLVDMGFRKEDVESALRTCNLRLEDALEMLNHHSRQRLPMGGDMPPPGAGPDQPHFPGQGFPQDGPVGGPGMPVPMPKMAAMHPMQQQRQQQQQQQPPQPQQQQQPGQQPSAQQLRLLVQQIQMAVQAGHLNPQILNQPLAPQTLILLNQLLQQIKQLQQLQSQHMNASRSGNVNNTALMGVTVKITQTKQMISNLQNQISAQQANYLKNPQGMQQSSGGASGPPPHMQQQQLGNPLGPPGENPNSTMQEMMNGLSLMETSNGNGSRLHKWKLPSELSKAPGNKTSNLLLDNGPWGKDSNNGGWPDSKSGNASGSGNDAGDGIPEFEPGKPWKGPGLKNPDEDPTLTPGSVAAQLTIGLPKPTIASTTSTSESSSLGLTPSTWSLGSESKTSAKEAASAANWSTSTPTTTSSSLTQIGQDLWGSGKTNLRGGPPGMPPTSSSSEGGQAWSQGGNGSNGWSTGDNNGDSSQWLLLKNLTPQTDGSTLKTLCMQHGPLQHFDLFLNRSLALVMYASGREAAKVSLLIKICLFVCLLNVCLQAHKALNNCLLGNTTIHASQASEREVANYFQQLGVNQSGNGSGTKSPSSRDQTPSTTSAWSSDASAPSTTAVTTAASSSLFGTGSGSVWGAPDVHSYLPGDLLGEGNM